MKGKLNQAELSDEQIDVQLDGILKAAGTALRHYSMQKSKDGMRAALRNAVLSLSPAAASLEASEMLDERIIETVREIVEREGLDVQDEQQARLLEVVAIETVRALLKLGGKIAIELGSEVRES